MTTASDALQADSVVAAVIAYEQGELDAADTLQLFSGLIGSGLAWSLQGSYGRTADALISGGYLSATGDILREV